MQFRVKTSSPIYKPNEPMVFKNDDWQKRKFRNFILYGFAAIKFQ